MTAPKRKVGRILQVPQGVESDRADREFWASLTPEQRVLETWKLSVELWELKGWGIGEPGLRRPAVRTDRR